MGLVAQPVCSDKVVSQLTSNAKYSISSSKLDSYILKIHSVEGSIVKAWILRVYSFDGRKDFIKIDPKFSKVGSSKELHAFDFSNDTSALLSTVDYNCNGEVIYSHSTPKDEVNYDVIVPDTTGGYEMKTVKEIINESANQ
jgi:hypothetical protein